MGGAVEVLEEVGLAVVLGVVEAALVVDLVCDVEVELLVDAGTLDLDDVGPLELGDVLDAVDVDDELGVVDAADEVVAVEVFNDVLELVVDGGLEVTTEVVEGVGCTTGGVVDVLVEVVDVKSGSGVGSAEHPPFEHT